MGLFDKYKQQSALNRMQEERLFAFVSEELQSGDTRPGLYAQALVEAEGDDKKARAAYIKLRVQSLKDEYTIQQLIDEIYLQEEARLETQLKTASKGRSRSKSKKAPADDLAAHEARVRRQEEFALKPSKSGSKGDFWGSLSSEFREARAEENTKRRKT